jgi:tetratricopeptide (TPR) repeat protein
MPRAFELLQAGDIPAARKICRKILRADATHADANNCLGVIHQRLGQPAQAVPLFERALTTDPGYVPAYGNLANSLAQLGRLDDVKQVVDRGLSLRPGPAIANRALGELAYQVAEYAKSEAFYRRSLAVEPADFLSHLGLGMTLRRLGRLEEALACYESANRLQPGNASVHLNRGNLLSVAGRIADAIESYREAIRLQPDYARAHQLLAGVREQSSHDAELEAMEALYNKAGISAEDRMNLGFGLGKAFEDLEQYDKAFSYFKQANKKKRSLTPYSMSEDVKFFDRLKTTFDAKFFEQRRDLGAKDDSPIFILGMPRSGTSLVEQILSRHPQVYGAGELADLQIVCKGAVEAFPDEISQLTKNAWPDLAGDYLQRLRHHDASAPRIIDKMPQNFLYIGMIAIMLPNAKIIHCRREPLDTCLSLFKNLFASNGHQWSYDIKDLGRYYRLYQGLMEHWNRILPGRIYDIQYESLVADSEQQIRKLLNFCELSFDPACLSFHESKRAVQTASFAQVRKPIYSSSVNRWKRYEKHLQPLLSELGGA